MRLAGMGCISMYGDLLSRVISFFGFPSLIVIVTQVVVTLEVPVEHSLWRCWKHVENYLFWFISRKRLHWLEPYFDLSVAWEPKDTKQVLKTAFDSVENMLKIIPFNISIETFCIYWNPRSQSRCLKVLFIVLKTCWKWLFWFIFRKLRHLLEPYLTSV